MKNIQFIKTTVLAISIIVVLTSTAGAEEFVLNISSVDTFRVSGEQANLFGALPVQRIPSGDSIYIDFAELVFSISATIDSAHPMLLMVNPITVDWIPEQRDSLRLLATPNDGYNPRLGGLHPVTVSAQDQEIHIDVTSIVCQWHNGSLENRGLLINSTQGNGSAFSLIRDGRYEGGHAKLRIVYCKP